MTLKIGLTGGIGSGKSLVSAEFESLGIPVIDADVIAKDTVKLDSDALHAITQHFGKHILLSDGHLNRAALRDIIFSNAVEKRWLESLLHPLINQQIERALAAASSPYAVLASPLLLEGDQKKQVDRIVVVDVPADIQIDRASARDGVDKEQIQRIIDSQIKRKERAEQADFIIDNSQSIQHTLEQTRSLHQTLLQLSELQLSEHER